LRWLVILLSLALQWPPISESGSLPMSSIPTLDQFQFHHVLEETSGVVLVFFSGPHCGACRHLRGVLEHYLKSGLIKSALHFPESVTRNQGHCRLFDEKQ
jgi:thiol-disulfide isomerase/thioredoxin